jgi:hypothetical protein
MVLQFLLSKLLTSISAATHPPILSISAIYTIYNLIFHASLFGVSNLLITMAPKKRVSTTSTAPKKRARVAAPSRSASQPILVNTQQLPDPPSPSPTPSSCLHEALRYMTYSSVPSMKFSANKQRRSATPLPSASPHQNPVLAKGLLRSSKVSWRIRRAGAGLFVVPRDSSRVGTRETRVAAAAQQERERDDGSQGDAANARSRRSQCSMRALPYQQRREAAHAAQTSLDFAGKSESFINCISYLLMCGIEGRWCGNNNSDSSVPREVVDVVKERLAEWQLTQYAHEERARVNT